jgi:hypothetical protein
MLRTNGQGIALLCRRSIERDILCVNGILSAGSVRHRGDACESDPSIGGAAGLFIKSDKVVKCNIKLIFMLKSAI